MLPERFWRMKERFCCTYSHRGRRMSSINHVPDYIGYKQNKQKQIFKISKVHSTITSKYPYFSKQPSIRDRQKLSTVMRKLST